MLLYLRGTSNYCITFDGCSDLVCGYVDSYFVRALDQRRYTSGYVFTLARECISCMSKLQEIIALSTTKVEYIDVSHACKETIWLKVLLGEFGNKHGDVNVLCDSQMPYTWILI